MSKENLKSLQDLFEHEIKDLYNAEEQLTKALPKMAEKASNQKLKKAFEDHLEETKHQIERLQEVCNKLKIEPTGEKCKAMEGLIKEAKDMLGSEADPDVMDAGLIAAAQRVEHYEIAGYGTAANYAKKLGHNEIVSLLEETLKEEKKTDAKLNKLAVDSINEKAMK
ncbi:MAG: ferritin-like domain-containing protein [Bacteroidota bacterium]|jgi:ferritin-like metal-binding protein YciE|nr:ferritin-like domain-containing protein [Bacteroidota bacterium]